MYIFLLVFNKFVFYGIAYDLKPYKNTNKKNNF